MDALDLHFHNILKQDSAFGGNHAAILKQHIDNLVAGHLSLRRPATPPTTRNATDEQLSLMPGWISQSAPQATLDPPANLGKLLICWLGDGGCPPRVGLEKLTWKDCM
jgi:hypothetical protein